MGGGEAPNKAGNGRKVDKALSTEGRRWKGGGRVHEGVVHPVINGSPGLASRSGIAVRVMQGAIFVFIGAVIIGYNLFDTFEPHSLKGKNVLITGASMGIGEQMAYHYAQMGARIVITARSEERLKKIIEQCREIGGTDGVYFYILADMSNSADIQKLAQTTVEKLGGIDYLVLNHIATDRATGPWQGSESNHTNLQYIMSVNFYSYVYLAFYALPALERSDAGSIVVVSSLAGRVSQPYFLEYSTSKFALDGFFIGFGQQLIIRSSRVSVTMCYLGLIDTEHAMASVSSFKRIMSMSPQCSASDAAYAIIRGGALHEYQIFYPYVSTKIVTLINSVAPQLYQSFQQYMYGS